MTHEEVLARVIARRKSAKRAEPADPSLQEMGERGQDAPAVGTLPAGPFPAVCAWLRSMRLIPESAERSAPRWAKPKPAALLETTAPPYVLSLVACLERIGDGTATDPDRQRLAAWIPIAIHHARLEHDAAELLAELDPDNTYTPAAEPRAEGSAAA